MQQIDEELFVELYNDGLTHDEIESCFNVSRGIITRLIKKYSLKRPKPKADFSYRYGRANRHGAHVSKLKSTYLKKCLNPTCDCYFYGYDTNKYCCQKCANHVNNLNNKEYFKEWRRNNKDKVKRSEEKSKMKKLLLMSEGLL